MRKACDAPSLEVRRLSYRIERASWAGGQWLEDMARILRASTGVVKVGGEKSRNCDERDDTRGSMTSEQDLPVVIKLTNAILLDRGAIGICSVAPTTVPYFEPKMCRISCFCPENPNRQEEIKLGFITVGGALQHAFDKLPLVEDPPDDYPGRIHNVEWWRISTPGLARELQLHLLNPSEDKQVVVSISVYGRGIPPEEIRAELGLLDSAESS